MYTQQTPYTMKPNLEKSSGAGILVNNCHFFFNQNPKHTMFTLHIKSQKYACITIEEPKLNAHLSKLAENNIGLVSLEPYHYHISLGGVTPKTFEKYGKSEFILPVSKTRYDFIASHLTSRGPAFEKTTPIIRGHQTRKSKAIEINRLVLYTILGTRPKDIEFDHPMLNNNITLHISLANLTGNPRHSLKDPFGFKPRWIGVDLDGTLAHKGEHYTGEIGHILPRMKQRILDYLSDGMEVKIFTARVAQECTKTGRTIPEIISLIQDWLESNELPRLDVTCIKNRECIRIYDDKATQVVPDADITLYEKLTTN